MAGTQHIYTTPAGPNDALHEWLFQAVGAYTRQFHADKKSGPEGQILIQGQYSLTSKQWTLLGGIQPSYVFALPANLQLSFWLQLTGGANLATGVAQLGLSAGTQLQWAPTDFLAIGAQAGAGPTWNRGGANSVDVSGLVFIQIMK